MKLKLREALLLYILYLSALVIMSVVTIGLICAPWPIKSIFILLAPASIALWVFLIHETNWILNKSDE